MKKIKNVLVITGVIGIFLTLVYGFIPNQLLSTAIVPSSPQIEEKKTKNNIFINIYGEVKQPGIYSIDKDHITLKEIIKKAGDFTCRAQKDAIVILRKQNKKRVITYANAQINELSSFNEITLQHNDIVYIESLDFSKDSSFDYKELLPFASAFLCMAVFLFSAFKG